mmetsp:Transcript_15792/g.28361  ORF Transcript_15792/g.28361 Transcript_15792/m.28361 type:complete len:222 (-) Transcript_15792:1461-2126(-)
MFCSIASLIRNQCTYVSRVCPIRWTLPAACRCWAGLRLGSVKITCVASVRLSPWPPLLSCSSSAVHPGIPTYLSILNRLPPLLFWLIPPWLFFPAALSSKISVEGLLNLCIALWKSLLDGLGISKSTRCVLSASASSAKTSCHCENTTIFTSGSLALRRSIRASTAWIFAPNMPAEPLPKWESSFEGLEVPFGLIPVPVPASAESTSTESEPMSDSPLRST